MTIFNQTDCIISALWNYIVLNLLKTYPISVFKSWKYYKNAVCFGKIFVIIKNVKSFCLRQAGKQVRQKIRQIKVWKKIKVVWCCKWSKKGLRQIWRADRRERERDRERDNIAQNYFLTHIISAQCLCYKHWLFKYRPIPSSFCLFSFFSNNNSNLNWKKRSIDFLL